MQLSPQQQALLSYLRKTDHITVRSAMLDLKIMALPRRIKDLEERGYWFTREDTKHPTTGQRYTRYSLVEPRRRAA